MKIIKKVAVSPIPPLEGSVSDTINVEDKITNAPSIRLAQNMMGIPTDGIIEFDGDTVPEGYEQVYGIGDYSTDEIRIGTWIDGKPLYRKIISFEGSATVATGIDISDLNINQLVEIGGIMKEASYDWVPLNLSWQNKFSLPQFTKNSNTLYLNNTGLTIRYGFFILEYTKTTD